MPTYRNISRHVRDLADGRVVGVGEEITVDEALPDMVEQGIFLEIPDSQAQRVSTPTVTQGGES